MDPGHWLTRGTVWLSITFYIAAQCAECGPRHPARDRLARLLFTAGCVALLAHFVSAFHFYHGWSHRAAYVETARQTAQLLGWNWGGGLFVNYAFALVWIAEVGWIWLGRQAHEKRPDWIRWSVRGFFLLMIVNGAFVFVAGPRRWFGLFLCLILLSCWVLAMYRKVDRAGPDH